MICILYTNTSESFRRNKELDKIKELDIVLKNEEEYVNPTIILKNITGAELNKCNYVDIPKLHRKYFITSKKRISNNIVEIGLHCDVLSSFYNDYSECYGIMERNENNYNLYLDDGQFKTYSNPIISTHKFPHGFSANEFVLAVAGG